MRTTVFPIFRWFVLLTLCIVTASTAVALIAPAPLMGPIAKTLGISLGEATGATMGSFNLFVAFSCIIGGWFLDRFGPVRVWLTCLILIIIGLLLIPSCGTTFGGMNMLRIIQGIGTGPIMASTARVAAQWFPAQERGIVTGIQGMSMGLGIAIGFMVAPGLFQANGDWATTMAWMSVLSFIALAMTLVMAFGPKPPADHSVDSCATPTGGESEFKLALKQPVTWAAIGCVVWMGWIMQGFNDLTPAYIAIPAPVGLGMGPMVAGKFMTALQASFMIGAVLSGFIVEKLASGRSKPVILIGFLCFAAFAFSIKLTAVTSSDATLLICLILAGFFEAQVIPPAIAFIARNYPEHLTGRLGGLAQGLSVFGGTAGVFAGATALHITGVYQMSINIVIMVALVGCIFALGLNRPKSFCTDDKMSIDA